MITYTISNTWPERLERSVSGASRRSVGGHVHYLTVMLVKNPDFRRHGSRPGIAIGKSVMGYDFISLICARIEEGFIKGTVADCWSNKSYEAVVPVKDVRWCHVMYEALSPRPNPLPELEGYIRKEAA